MNAQSEMPPPVADNALSTKASVESNSASVANADETNQGRLRPREHGAYAIIGIPIATAFVAGGHTWVGISIAVAAISGFLAHEPMLVTLGLRGARAQRTAPKATNHMLMLLAFMLIAGVAAFVLGSTLVRWSLLGCLALGCMSVAVSVAGQHRSLAGQLSAVASLSAPSVPILLSGTTEVSQSINVWCCWLIGFASTTLAVRGVLAAQKHQSLWPHRAAITALTVLVSILVLFHTALPASATPMLAMSLYLTLHPPPAKQLRRVGWSLVVGTTGTAVWMLVLLQWT